MLYAGLAGLAVCGSQVNSLTPIYVGLPRSALGGAGRGRTGRGVGATSRGVWLAAPLGRHHQADQEEQEGEEQSPEQPCPPRGSAATAVLAAAESADEGAQASRLVGRVGARARTRPIGGCSIPPPAVGTRAR